MWSMKIVKGSELADKPLTELRLPQPLARFTIGRDKGATWALDDRTLALSGRHCEIVDTPGGPALRDLSTNGTFVNGAATRLVGDHLLRDGDRIEMGPFVFMVSGPPMPERPVAPVSPPALAPVPARSPGVTDTAPFRGGDPAAMLAAGAAGAPVGLTEILRVAKPRVESDTDLTRIRLVTPASARGGAAAGAESVSPPPAQRVPAPVPEPPPAAAQPAASSQPLAQAPSPGTSAVHEALARGLGLPVAALAGHDPLQLVEQLARTAHAATAALRQLMDHQAQARRSLGSRQSVGLPHRDAHPLRLAPSAEAAVLALMAEPGGPGPQATLQRTAQELCAHQDRLLKACRTAAQRLGAQMAPEALQEALAAGGAAVPADPARLWQLYGAVWSELGLAPSQGWAAGFQEAALQHLAAAYDDTAS